MKFESKTEVVDGMLVETGTVIVNGKSFTNLGSCVDEENGRISAYISGTHGSYILQTWDGQKIADISFVKHIKMCNSRHPNHKLWFWLMKYNGRTWTGRNSGPQMLIRLRALKAPRVKR